MGAICRKEQRGSEACWFGLHTISAGHSQQALTYGIKRSEKWPFSSKCWDFYISIESHFQWLFLKGEAVWVHYHPELGWDQVGVLHGGVEGQNAVRAPAEQHGFKRSVGIELQSQGKVGRGGGFEGGVGGKYGKEWKVNEGEKKNSQGVWVRIRAFKATFVMRFYYLWASHKPGITAPGQNLFKGTNCCNGADQNGHYSESGL